jgi:predicted  nucleic acid-binding Zn-ribbon protein
MEAEEKAKLLEEQKEKDYDQLQDRIALISASRDQYKMDSQNFENASKAKQKQIAGLMERVASLAAQVDEANRVKLELAQLKGVMAHQDPRRKLVEAVTDAVATFKHATGTSCGCDFCNKWEDPDWNE